jgi:hypothetical protein
MNGSTFVWRQSARHQGAAAALRVVCPASPSINIGGGFEQRHALRPEGGLGLDRHQIQI